VRGDGAILTAELGDEPMVVARGEDGVLARLQWCRHTRGGSFACFDRSTRLRQQFVPDHGGTYEMTAP